MARRFPAYFFSGHVRDTSSTAPRRANASTEESEGLWSRPGACTPSVGGAGDSSPSAVPCPWYSSAWSPAQPPHVSAGLCQRGRGLPPVRAPALYRVFSPAPRPSLGASAGGDAGTGLGRRGGEPAPDGQRLRRGPPHRLRRPPCRAPAAAPGGAVAWRHVEGLDVLLRLCAPAWRNNWHSALTQRSIRALSLYLSGSMVLTMGRRSRRCKRSVAHLCKVPQRDISDLSVTFRHT